jgi:DnaK suppressor protein
MKNASVGINGFQRILERRELELVHALRSWDHISIERSADQMDELQLASERDLAIRNLDSESVLLRQVRAALQRIHDGGFGICIECEQAIGSKRLAAVPWAPRCIRCQEAADGEGEERTDFSMQTMLSTA